MLEKPSSWLFVRFADRISTPARGEITPSLAVANAARLVACSLVGWAPPAKRLISHLVGEMAGRPEGGAKE
jgi:hypothetical protein